MQYSNQSNLNNLARLVFLAAETKIPLPRGLKPLVMDSELIDGIARKGIAGATADFGLMDEYLLSLYEEGSSLGPASYTEFRLLLSDMAEKSLTAQRPEMTFSDYMSKQAFIQRFLIGRENLVEAHEVSLASPEALQAEDIIKFNTGFSPLDLVTGGLYQGIFTLLGAPGTGKTSLLLTLMAAIRENDAASEIWFFEPEIPMNLVLWRAQPILNRVKFKPQDKFITGLVDPEEIVEMVRDNPDPDRIILMDSLHVLAGDSDEGKRHKIERMYRDLIRLKDQSRLVVVTTQPRRNDDIIRLSSGAESASIERYSDAIIGIMSQGRAPNGSRLKLNVPKNRFGTTGSELSFIYRYHDLTWVDPTGLSTEHGWDEDDSW